MIDHEAMKKQPQMEITVVHHEADGLYTKEMHIPAGTAVGKHKHPFSHQSILGKGHIRLIMDEEEVEVQAPAVLLIRANVWHTIIAVTDTVWYCIHNTDRVEHEKLV